MNIDLIRAAEARLKGAVRETPLLSSPALDDMAGRPVLGTGRLTDGHTDGR